MSTGRVYLDYLQDMYESAEKALQFVGEMNFQQFAEDDKTTFAVIRALEILGEAAKKIPEEIRRQYDDVPWREMTGTRDVLIHEYFGVNLAVVWRTVQEDLPPLLEKLRKILNDF